MSVIAILSQLRRGAEPVGNLAELLCRGLELEEWRPYTRGGWAWVHST